MFTESFIDKSPIWIPFMVTFALLAVGCEIGFRLGGYSKARWPEAGKSSAAPIMGSALGLLAFLLAFTFGMSSSRFDTRKNLVLDEAGALMVTYKRAQSLPEPQRTECTQLLQEYVQERLEIVEFDSMEAVQESVLRSERIQDALWNQAVNLSEQPNAVLSLFMQSLSSLTEYQIKRVRAATWNRIPLAILIALYGIGFFALAALGFNSGMNERRPLFPVIMLILAFSCVIVLIIDLERPRQQLFKVTQEPIIDIARRMEINQTGDMGR